MWYLVGVLTPSSHCNFLIEIPLGGQTRQENGLSIAPVATMDWTNSTILTNMTAYSKMSFLVQIKFITEDSEQTHKQILILN